jgi:hypothetical protein
MVSLPTVTVTAEPGKARPEIRGVDRLADRSGAESETLIAGGSGVAVGVGTAGVGVEVEVGVGVGVGVLVGVGVNVEVAVGVGVGVGNAESTSIKMSPKYWIKSLVIT